MPTTFTNPVVWQDFADGDIIRVGDAWRPVTGWAADSRRTRRYLHPPLTAIRQDTGELGRRSLGRLLDHLAAPGNESRPAHWWSPPNW